MAQLGARTKANLGRMKPARAAGEYLVTTLQDTFIVFYITFVLKQQTFSPINYLGTVLGWGTWSCLFRDFDVLSMYLRKMLLITKTRLVGINPRIFG